MPSYDSPDCMLSSFTEGRHLSDSANPTDAESISVGSNLLPAFAPLSRSRPRSTLGGYIWLTSGPAFIPFRTGSTFTVYVWPALFVFLIDSIIHEPARQCCARCSPRPYPLSCILTAGARLSNHEGNRKTGSIAASCCQHFPTSDLESCDMIVAERDELEEEYSMYCYEISVLDLVLLNFFKARSTTARIASIKNLNKDLSSIRSRAR